MSQGGKTFRVCFSTGCALLLLICAAHVAAAQQCTHLDRPAFYSQGDFRVRDVRLESPIDFLRAIASKLKRIKSQLPLQPGSVFKLEDMNAGREMIEASFSEDEKSEDPRSGIRVILAKIANCQENNPPRELDVVYRVFTTHYNSYLSHTWELKADEIKRPATTAATAQANGYLTLKPFIDYNRTRKLHGGVVLDLQLPGDLFHTMEFGGSGSTTGNLQEFEIAGSRTPEKTALSRLEYRLAYKHSDLPAGDNRLRQGVLSAQLFGATQPLGSRGLIIRFGASFEGGNQQTDLTAAAAADESLASSGYGGLKSYLGATLRSKNYSFAGSYALQVGTRGATTEVGFVKHIGDLAFTGRWLPKRQNPEEVHKALTLEAHLSGGTIQTLGNIPVTQRFFGGNVERNFIEGDSWRIRNGPFIRSIPENRLNGSSAIQAIGGTSFFALNLTVARPVWGRPILPKELATDPEFFPALESSKVSARNILLGAYLSKINVFSGILAKIPPVEANIDSLTTLLANMPEEFPEELDESLREALDESRGLLSDDSKIIGRILKDKKTLPSKLRTLLKEENSTTCIDDESCSQLTRLRFHLAALEGSLQRAGFTEASTSARTIRESLAAQQAALILQFDSIDIGEAERLADADMKLVEATLDAFINELNWLAVSPVLIFDAARLVPDRAGMRYGVGGGIRLSVVNFNVTLGYAFNPSRQPGEGRGALFFTMDVTDVFRR